MNKSGSTLAVKRTGKDSSERGKIRREWLDGRNSTLVVALVVSEEKGTVLTNWPADLIAKLGSLKKRIWIGLITLQTGIGSEVVVAIKVKTTAVKRVAARTRYDIDRPHPSSVMSRDQN